MSTALLIREAGGGGQSTNFSWVEFITRTITSTALSGMQGALTVSPYIYQTNDTSKSFLTANEQAMLLESACGFPVMLRADSFSASGAVYVCYNQSYVEFVISHAVGIAPAIGSTASSAQYNKCLYHQDFESNVYNTGLIDLKSNGWFACAGGSNRLYPEMYILGNGDGSTSGTAQGTPSTSISVTATLAYLNSEPDIE